MSDNNTPKRLHGISAVVNTYNAAKHLEAVLSSLRKFDEIVVVDMESTDNTREIAERFGARIITFPKNGYTYVEPARQTAINSTRYDYALVVDADEIVSPQLHDYLYSLIDGENPPAGLMIPRKNSFMHRDMPCYYPDYVLRFMKSDGCTWSDKIHSTPKPAGRIDRIPRGRKDLALCHLDDAPIADRVIKMNKYTEYERQRRASGYHFVQILYRPAFRFIKTYILKGGWRAGKQGFIAAMMDAYYCFIYLAKIEEDRQIRS